jgi:hypothetical protein
MLVSIRQTVLNYGLYGYCFISTEWFLGSLSASDLFLSSVNKLSVLGLSFFRRTQKGVLLLLPESAFIRGIFSAKISVQEKCASIQPHVVITEYEMTYTLIELHKVSIFCQTHFPPNI